MLDLLLMALLFLVSVYGFVHEVRADAKRYYIKDLEGDLHMLKEFKKFSDENGLDSSKFDVGIKEMEEKIKAVSRARTL